MWSYKVTGERYPKREPVPAEQLVIRQVRKLRSEGLSYRDIAGSLNSRMVPTRSGKPWSFTTVASILKRNK